MERTLSSPPSVVDSAADDGAIIMTLLLLLPALELFLRFDVDADGGVVAPPAFGGVTLFALRALLREGETNAL